MTQTDFPGLLVQLMEGKVNARIKRMKTQWKREPQISRVLCLRRLPYFNDPTLVKPETS